MFGGLSDSALSFIVVPDELRPNRACERTGKYLPPTLADDIDTTRTTRYLEARTHSKLELECVHDGGCPKRAERCIGFSRRG